MNKPTMILGASSKPDRYANKAQKLLQVRGHTVIPVNPRESLIDGEPVLANINDYQGVVDTVTVYVRPTVLQEMIEDLIKLKPKRVILNPGTEDDGLKKRLVEAGIETVENCTLVLLKSDQY